MFEFLRAVLMEFVGISFDWNNVWNDGIMWNPIDKIIPLIGFETTFGEQSGLTNYELCPINYKIELTYYSGVELHR